MTDDLYDAALDAALEGELSDRHLDEAVTVLLRASLRGHNITGFLAVSLARAADQAGGDNLLGFWRDAVGVHHLLSLAKAARAYGPTGRRLRRNQVNGAVQRRHGAPVRAEALARERSIPAEAVADELTVLYELGWIGRSARHEDEFYGESGMPGE